MLLSLMANRMALLQRNPSSVWRAVLALVVATLLLQAFQFAVPPVVSEPGQKVPVSTVAWLTLAMAVTTGLGAVPFFFVQLDPRWGGMCNGVASGVMLAASFELIEEGQKYGEGSTVVLGIMAGGVFIFLSQRFVHDNFGEVSMLDVKGTDVPKMILVVSVMTLHSFGEGSGVGVSFAGPKEYSQGLMVTVAIAVHNIPEGLAVSLLLSNQGLSPKNSLLWSIFTSLPQPLVAVPAFMCAEAFHKFLPFCMGFAGGCMIWMVMAEVLPDSFKDADSKEGPLLNQRVPPILGLCPFAVTFMVGLRAFLDNTEGTTVVENVNMLLAYLSFGIGPFIGALKHMLLLSSIDLRVTMATGIGEGVSFVVAAWKPLQMLLDGKMNIFKIFFLLCAGAFLHFLLRKYVEAKSKTSSKIEIVLPGASGELSPKARRACLASFVIWFYTFVEGLAMGVAATSGFYFYLLFPMALHGLPRGVGVGSIVYGATGSRKGSCLAVALTCLASPIGSISAVLTGVGPNQCWSGIII